MKKPLIKRVENNKNKGKTYSELIRKYNEAISNEFYGEAELIVYAFLEDRLRSFIYDSDFTEGFNSNKINENAEEVYGKDLDIKDISCKIGLIRKALNVCTKKTAELNGFEMSLKKRYRVSIKVAELKSVLKQIEKWCKYRNEIVHAMFNKDLDDLRRGYEHHVKDGMKLARYIDSQVQSLKNA